MKIDMKPKSSGTKTRGRKRATMDSNGSSSKKEMAKMSSPTPMKKQRMGPASSTASDNEMQGDNDDERRKNFLERNRQAALKCRQRKKQWLANLQAKVEFFSQENEALNNEINDLRGEMIQLKTILHSHRDCPQARALVQGGLMDQISRDLEESGVLTLGSQSQHQHHPHQMQAMNGLAVGGYQ